MDSNFINVEIDKIDDIVHFESFSDEHYGDPKRDKELCNRRSKAVIEDPLRYTGFGGDQFNNIMPWDKRYTLEASDPIPSLTREVTEWDEHHAELFKLNKELIDKKQTPKIWYGLAGNHEYMDKHIDHYWMNKLFTDRNIKYLGSKGWIGLQISHNDVPLRRWKIFAAHGFGSSTLLEKPLEDLKVNNYADVFFMGHLHRKHITQQIIYDYSFTEKQYVEKEIVLANTGTFSNSIIRGRDSWYEHRNKGVHSRPGTITVSFDAYNGKLACHL